MKHIKTLLITLLFLLICLLIGCVKTEPHTPTEPSPPISPKPSESSPPFIIHQEIDHAGEAEELIFNGVYFVYYLSNAYSDQVFIEFPDGHTVPLKEALEKKLVGIDELMENGLDDVIVYPVNPEFFSKGQGFFISNREDQDFLLVINGYEHSIEKYFLHYIIKETSNDGRDHLFFEIDALIDYFLRSEAKDAAEMLQQYSGDLVRIGNQMYISGDTIEKLGIGSVTLDGAKVIIEM
ncbi:MAG: hypothetical protein ACOX88_02205 [Christensenellales bacterium]|jgi:hypothetical protein